jgi:DNA-binding transcriptional LysR family regulator
MAIREVVSNSDLAVTLPSAFARLSNVHPYVLPFTPPKWELLLYWHRNTHEDAAHRWLRELARKAGAL